MVQKQTEVEKYLDIGFAVQLSFVRVWIGIIWEYASWYNAICKKNEAPWQGRFE